jgi:hypothetical protein
MKKLFLLLTLLTLGFTSYSQSGIRFRLRSATTNQNINGQPIGRGDIFEMVVDANGNGDLTTRQLLFDFQYDQINFELISINHTGTEGNGGVLPGGSNPQLSWTNHPNFTYAGNNTVVNGTTRFTSGLNYQFQQNGPNAILRATLTWATNSGMPYNEPDRLLVLRFRLRTSSTAFTFNPIRLNFVAGWNGQGNYTSTVMDSPLSNTVNMDQNIGKLVTAKVDINSNLLALSNVRVSFRDTVTNQGVLFNVLNDGTIDVNQSQLQANRVYDVTVMHEMDKMYATYGGAITVSDFTTAQSEFSSIGLDGVLSGNSIRTGQSYYAADINKNRNIDGGDLPSLLAQVVGIDTLFTLPQGYNVGQGGWMGLPTWRAEEATTTAGPTEWAIITVNGFSQGVSSLQIDMREFNGSGVTPNQISSLQLFDLYSGPVEFVNNDATWATYRIPSSISTITTTTTYPGFIRNMGSNAFGLRAEFDFRSSPNSSWGSITPSNWRDITNPRTIVKTGAIGSNTVVNLKYMLWGDVNRSHSSQVITSVNGISSVRTNAANSLTTNNALKVMSANINNDLVNTINDLDYINVNLSNNVVTSNTIEIPISLDTRGANVNALQFEFVYDATKIKFEEIKSELPNTWYIFASPKNGVIKFGAIDQNTKSPIKGVNVPFKLRFSTIQNGLDITSQIRVTKNMDASDNKGNQLGIKLNTTTIKLTGYNKFN